MGLETPRLDDRSFDDLVQEARQRIALYTPEWTDHNLSDPGITLIELFAYMTDIVLYRLNRVPDKHFIKFMELIGMQLHEAKPARVPVTFWLTTPQDTPIIIRGGTEVATTRTETEPAIIFSTDGDLEVVPPTLSDIMTSGASGDGNRSFETYDVASVAIGYEGFEVFASRPPQSDDSLYLGFEQDVSNHIIGVELEVSTAEGAGIDPTNPPYVWEVLSTEVDLNWVPVQIDVDETLGLNRTGMIRLHLPSMRRAARNERTAYWLRLRLDLSKTENAYDISPRVHRLRVSSWGGTVNATNVTRVYNEVLGRSDGAPGERFYLEHHPLVARTKDEYLIVRRENGYDEPWQEVSDFSTSAANDRHYTIDSNTGEVRLGPALQQPDGQMRLFGAIPPKGSLVIMSAYRYGGGQIGNVAENTINVLKTAIPYIERVRNRQTALGGTDAETLEYAKMRVPGFLRSLRRAVTASDFEYLAEEAAPGEIGRVYCLQPPLTNRGEIKILVVPRVPRLSGYIPPESLNLTDQLQETIRRFLDERRLLSTRLEVSAPAYQWVETEVRLRVTETYNQDRVRRDVETKLFDFLNPLIGGFDGKGWTFGRDLFVADVMSVLLTVPGVNFVRSVSLYPITYAEGQFVRGAAAQEIPIASHGVVVSYQHNIVIV